MPRSSASSGLMQDKAITVGGLVEIQAGGDIWRGTLTLFRAKISPMILLSICRKAAKGSNAWHPCLNKTRVSTVYSEDIH